MVYIKGTKLCFSKKKPKNIEEKKISVYIEFLSCYFYNDQSKKNLKKIINNFNNISTIDDILNINLISDSEINNKEIIDIINKLFISSNNLNNINYFYEKNFYESSDKLLLNFLKIHEEVEKFFRKILKNNYSSFFPSLNRYIDYSKQK